MKDRSLGKWLVCLFGVSGLAAIGLVWALPGLHSERISATLVGLVGIAIAVIRGLALRKERPALEAVKDEE
jgi:hypothetical protein